MKKNLKTVGLTIGAFVTGVVATLAILYIFVVPDIAEEIGVFANEGAIRAYQVGYNDGRDEYGSKLADRFDYEIIEKVCNYEYKFIKQ